MISNATIVTKFSPFTGDLNMKYLGILLALSFLLPAAALAQGKAANAAGTWELTLTFVRGTAKHTAIITQKDAALSGTYKGEVKEGKLQGTVKGNAVDFTGALKIQANTISFHYTGIIEGNTMKGTMEMGEFWGGTWTAKRK